MATDLVVAVNGAASHARDGPALLERVTRSLEGHGARVEGRVTATEAELGEALAAADGRRVVLVGGDGSLHAAVNRMRALPEIAVVPAGRANNVARALGIPADVESAARIAVLGTPRPLDMLSVETPELTLRCVEGVSAGLQAEARSLYDGENSADLTAGARALARTVRRFRPYRVAMSADGESYEGDAAQVFLANLPYFGFGFRVDPVARPADGLLEAIVIEAESRAGVVRAMVAAYRGRHLGMPGVSIRRVHAAALSAPMPLAGDGTPLGVHTARVRVEPDRLRLVAPWPA